MTMTRVFFKFICFLYFRPDCLMKMKQSLADLISDIEWSTKNGLFFTQVPMYHSYQTKIAYLRPLLLQHKKCKWLKMKWNFFERQKKKAACVTRTIQCISCIYLLDGTHIVMMLSHTFFMWNFCFCSEYRSISNLILYTLLLSTFRLLAKLLYIFLLLTVELLIQAKLIWFYSF